MAQGAQAPQAATPTQEQQLLELKVPWQGCQRIAFVVERRLWQTALGKLRSNFYSGDPSKIDLLKTALVLDACRSLLRLLRCSTITMPGHTPTC